MLVITAPASGHVLRPLRRDEARENRPRGLGAGYPPDNRDDLFHPGDVPVGALGKNCLHVDAEMHGSGSERAIVQIISHVVYLSCPPWGAAPFLRPKRRPISSPRSLSMRQLSFCNPSVICPVSPALQTGESHGHDPSCRG